MPYFRFALALLLSVPALAITVPGDDPNASQFLASPGTSAAGVNFDGVVKLVMNGGTSLCTGALLSSGWDILTAGHCVAASYGAALPSDTVVYFETGSLGSFTRYVTNYSVHPGWTGDASQGGDVGVLRLDAAAPWEVPRYDVYTSSDEVGRAIELAGYGRKGTGATGSVAESFDARLRRHGANRYDAVASAFPGWSSGVLLADFDSGNPVNDAFAYLGAVFANADTDIADREVATAPGDSGGPSFLDGRIVGVHSFGTFVQGSNGEHLTPPDTDTALNSSFGELFGDTRVSAYASWIVDQQVPEPATALTVAAALGWLVWRRRPPRR